MIHVFITDIQTEAQSKKTLDHLNNQFPQLTFHFDLNETNKPYPCGHTVLRIAGDLAHPNWIKAELSQQGFSCDLLEDKVCV
ncbi:MAG: hypothetical protein ABJH98_05985 [Reichenbachiella sp.]|uniref:hypothetical protein n=1 Tax=Reichenbachiella sp. TaxID=2184521 RepID=UPI003297E4CA